MIGAGLEGELVQLNERTRDVVRDDLDRFDAGISNSIGEGMPIRFRVEDTKNGEESAGLYMHLALRAMWIDDPERSDRYLERAAAAADRTIERLHRSEPSDLVEGGFSGALAAALKWERQEIDRLGDHDVRRNEAWRIRFHHGSRRYGHDEARSIADDYLRRALLCGDERERDQVLARLASLLGDRRLLELDDEQLAALTIIARAEQEVGELADSDLVSEAADPLDALARRRADQLAGSAAEDYYDTVALPLGLAKVVEDVTNWRAALRRGSEVIRRRGLGPSRLQVRTSPRALGEVLEDGAASHALVDVRYGIRHRPGGQDLLVIARHRIEARGQVHVIDSYCGLGATQARTEQGLERTVRQSLRRWRFPADIEMSAIAREQMREEWDRTPAIEPRRDVPAEEQAQRITTVIGHERCAHDLPGQAEWKPNGARNAEVLCCEACGRDRLAIVYNHRLPEAPTGADAAAAIAWERYRAVLEGRDPNRVPSDIASLRERDGIADLAPRRYATSTQITIASGSSIEDLSRGRRRALN